MGEETTIDEVRALQGCMLDARYRLGACLGTGGVGLVFEATESGSGRRVAVKLLKRRKRTQGDVTRLLREARIAQRVRHANIVPVLDVADDEVLGAPFLVSEFIDGGSLRQWMTAHGPVTPERAVEMVVPLCDALTALHSAGVIHRDIKPENVLLDGAQGALTPRLTDFGIARDLDPDPEEPLLTEDGATLGTPRYMSPEQARGQRDIDEQTDLWALGVLLYELISAKTPFERENTRATIAAVLMAPIDRLDAVAPHVPASLAAVVARALERNRARRFETAAQLRDALLASLADAAERPAPAARVAPPEALPEVLPEVTATDAPVALATPAAPRARYARWLLLPLTLTVGLVVARAVSPPPVAHPAVRGAPPIAAPPAVVVSANTVIAPFTPVVREPAPVAVAPHIEPVVRRAPPRPLSAPPVHRVAPPDAPARAEPRVGANGAPIEGL